MNFKVRGAAERGAAQRDLAYFFIGQVLIPKME